MTRNDKITKEFWGIHYDSELNEIIVEDRTEQEIFVLFEKIREEIVNNHRKSCLYKTWENQYEEFINWRTLYFTQKTMFSGKQKKLLYKLLELSMKIIQEVV